MKQPSDLPRSNQSVEAITLWERKLRKQVARHNRVPALQTSPGYHKHKKRTCSRYISKWTIGRICSAITILTILSWRPAFSFEPAERFRVDLKASATLIFDWTKDRCDQRDTPDVSLRAFRDDTGKIHAFSTHEVNRALIGKSLDHLSHSCDVAYMGGHRDDPAQFDDRQWLTAFVTNDGRHVFALVHNEFHGYLRPQLCKSGKYLRCWSNVITYANSDDGGLHFTEPMPPTNLIASPPFPYEGDFGRPLGYFAPSNIVQKDGSYYFLFLATEFRSQRRGFCVVRTRDPSDPKSWRAWNGRDFSVSFIDPYRDTNGDAEQHTCSPVSARGLFSFGSLTYDEKRRQFIAVTGIEHWSRNGRLPAGVYLATSPDLIEWSDPILLADEKSLQDGGDANDTFGYFSLVDANSESRYYSTISAHPSLLLFYVKFSIKNAPLNRALVSRPVELDYALEAKYGDRH